MHCSEYFLFAVFTKGAGINPLQLILDSYSPYVEKILQMVPFGLQTHGRLKNTFFIALSKLYL
jgi:hypothetical protein